MTRSLAPQPCLSPAMMHSHCESCVSRHCTAKPDDITCCPIVSCDLGCGAKFHQCLQDEHSLLCQDERVSCINIQNGCPVMMPRRKLGSHLEVCPASVMCCPIEWNRWPMYSVEDKKKMNLPANIIKVRCGQLDVALAMRDQRMLMQSLNAPKKTKRILRNRLTTRYPAAPFNHRSSSIDSDMMTSEETSRNVSDDEGGNTPWNLGNYPPGLQRSVCSRLIHATKQTADSLSATLDVASNHLSKSAPSLDHIKESREVRLNKSVDSDDDDVDMKKDVSCMNGASGDIATNKKLSQKLDKNSCINKESTNNIDNSTKLCDILGVDINIDCITKYQPKPREMYTFLCAQELRRDEYAWHFKNIHNDIQSCLNGWMEQRCPLAYLGCTFSFRRFVPCKNGSAIIHSALLESFGLVTENSLETSSNNSPDADTDLSSNLTRKESHAMDANGKDSVAMVTAEPNSNGDSVAMTTAEADSNGIQGMVVESGYDYNHDPTSQYGTSPDVDQTKDSLTVADSGDEFVEKEVFTSYRAYSPIHVQYRPVKADSHCRDVSGLELLRLPFEVLQDIARRLDSFSLCNLALTSKLLRDVCCSLLDERGIVIQVWEKSRDADGRVRWQSNCNRWRFSTAFSPVKNWQFSGNNPIGEHLKVCKFNQDRIVRDSPFFVYPPGDAPMDNELRSLLAERQRDSVSVKLRELHQWYQKFQESREEENNDDESDHDVDDANVDDQYM